MNIALSMLFAILSTNSHAFDPEQVQKRIQDEMARLAKNLDYTQSRPKYNATMAKTESLEKNEEESAFTPLNLETAFGVIEDKIKTRQAAPLKRLKKRSATHQSSTGDIFSKDLDEELKDESGNKIKTK
jgi:hypothetical protein